MNKSARIGILIVSLVFTGLGLLAKNLPLGSPLSEKVAPEKIKGKVQGESSLPSEILPPDLPLLKGAELVSVLSDEKNLGITARVDQNERAVEKFYRAALREENWVEAEGSYRKDKRSLDLKLAAGGSGKTLIFLTYSFVPTR